jgi:hypothetical protein
MRIAAVVWQVCPASRRTLGARLRTCQLILEYPICAVPETSLPSTEEEAGRGVSRPTVALVQLGYPLLRQQDPTVSGQYDSV